MSSSSSSSFHHHHFISFHNWLWGVVPRTSPPTRSENGRSPGDGAWCPSFSLFFLFLFLYFSFSFFFFFFFFVFFFFSLFSSLFNLFYLFYLLTFMFYATSFIFYLYVLSFPLKRNRKVNRTSKHFKTLQYFTQKERPATQIPRFWPPTLLVKIAVVLSLFWL